jgi:hypothetical protein
MDVNRDGEWKSPPTGRKAHDRCRRAGGGTTTTSSRRALGGRCCSRTCGSSRSSHASIAR